MLTAYAIWKVNKKWGYVAWPIAIAIQSSTLFVRQHWIVDQIAAVAVALPIAYFAFNWLKYTKVPAEAKETHWWQIITSIGVAIGFMVLYIYAFYLL